MLHILLQRYNFESDSKWSNRSKTAQVVAAVLISLFPLHS